MERWNGKRWLRQNAPKLPGETLASVSCPSRRGCLVAGTFIQHGRAVMFAARWNGARWRIRRVPGPRGFRNPGLQGLSCASTRNCIGLLLVGGGQKPLFTVHWNGRRWELAQVAALPSGTHLSVGGVSCEPKGTCLAVGSFDSASGQPATLVERLQSSGWSVQASANYMVYLSAGLNDVSCTSDTSCTAVGGASSGPLVEHWDGSAWAIQDLPPDTVSDTFQAVSCPTPSGCAAVGSYAVNSQQSQALASVSNNGHWSMAQASPPGAIDSSLTGVSCATMTYCIAVGSYQSAANTASIPFAELWDGTAWSTRPVPSPADGNSPVLERVSCSSTTACIAVGQYTPFGSSQSRVLAEEWNGSSWAIQSTPIPSGASAGFAGVSCRSASVCVAVGYSVVSGPFPHPLAEIWTGTSWSLQSTPSPYDSSLIADSCPTATACTAVGSQQTLQGTAALVEAWNGSTWSTEQTPIVPSTPPSQYSLTGVSCGSAITCLTVGTLTYFPPAGGSTGSPISERRS